MNGYRVKQSSTVQRHLTGQQPLHYMCSTHVAEHKILSTVTTRPKSPHAYFWCSGLQYLWNPFFSFYNFVLLLVTLEEVFCKSSILLHSGTFVFIFGLLFMFTAVFTLPVNKLHQIFNRIFSIIASIFILNNDWKFWRPSIILTESKKEIISRKDFHWRMEVIVGDVNFRSLSGYRLWLRARDWRH